VLGSLVWTPRDEEEEELEEEEGEEV